MIAVIGGGPVGCYSAFKLASKGEKVNVYEEHSSIGKPVQCTGLLTSEIYNILKVDSHCVLNKLNRAKLISPEGKFIELKLGKPNIVVDRTLFDEQIAAMAASAGAKINLKSKFSGFSGLLEKKAKINGKAVEAEHIVGADGPMSLVAKESGLYGKRQLVVGAQARVKMKCDSDCFNTYFGIGIFSWLVPEGDGVARIGVVDNKNPNALLKKLISKVAKGGKVLDKQGGLIPIYNPSQKLKKGNVAVVGDAATQVKAVSFGGIIPGLLAAEALGKGIEKYEENCASVKKELRLNLLMRVAMDKLGVKDYNDIIGILSESKAKQVLEQEDRDFPSKFIFKLIKSEPRLWKYGLKVIW
ncbi:MAG: NAD(P)/FAD-dependent oxidoreductase [Nanoarchaeota archaeon]|nr:NAD(P)/FAD-dependent oxidoreductase [Nanoarchaeota archaeon]